MVLLAISRHLSSRSIQALSSLTLSAIPPLFFWRLDELSAHVAWSYELGGDEIRFSFVELLRLDEGQD